MHGGAGNDHCIAALWMSGPILKVKGVGDYYHDQLMIGSMVQC